jgi:hypothetical protein
MKFNNRTYTWSRPFTHIRHEWSVVGPSMAVSFHVSENAEYGDTAGLEFHYFAAPDYMRDDAPSHLDCKYAGGRCWHDGTSLYAMETLWPMFKEMLRAGDHDAVFGMLELEIERRAKKYEEVEP